MIHACIIPQSPQNLVTWCWLLLLERLLIRLFVSLASFLHQTQDGGSGIAAFGLKRRLVDASKRTLRSSNCGALSAVDLSTQTIMAWRLPGTTSKSQVSSCPRSALMLVFLLLCCCMASVECKTKKGSFRLTGVQTEKILATYMVVEHGGTVDITFTTDRPYENTSKLKFRAYRDTEISNFRKEPLCSRKMKYAKQTHDINFQQQGGKWKASVSMQIPRVDGSDKKRNYYWYFVIDDCSLEEYFHDNKVPTIEYELSAQNFKNKRRVRKSHLSAGDMVMPELYAFTFLISGIVWCYLFFRVMWKLGVSSAREVHIAVLWVAGAVGLDCWEAFFEIAHLHFYNKNGIGSYWADALSAYCAALSDSMIMVLLLSMAAGWTLGDSPTVSVVNANPVQEYISSLAKPGQSRGLIIAVFVYHIVLAQWGRTYDDDCDSYHYLEHLPGKILITMRVILGLVFLGAVRQTRDKFPKLKTFYTRYAFLGCAWFWYLPALSLFCSWFLPKHRRHDISQSGSAVLQCASLIMLAWLVTTQKTAFHKYSHMAPQDESLNERIASAPLGGGSGHRATSSIWKLGTKTKLRLD